MPHPESEPSSRLDPFVPVFDVHERHEVRVKAPAAVTWDAVQSMDFRQSRVVRAIFRGREWLMGSRHTAAPAPRPFIEEAYELGWRPLLEEPGRALVMGAVTQPWLPDVTFRGMPPADFAAFSEPGFARLAWTLEVEPLGPDTSRVRTDTRVATTDEEAASRFRRYWWLVAPGILLIRRRALALVKADAERRFAASAPPASSSAP